MINDDVIGYAVVYKFPSLSEESNLAYLYDIEIVTTHRRKGAGTMLIHAILQEMKEANVSELWLGTSVENIEEQALFSAPGGIRSEECLMILLIE